MFDDKTLRDYPNNYIPDGDEKRYYLLSELKKGLRLTGNELHPYIANLIELNLPFTAKELLEGDLDEITQYNFARGLE